MSTGFVNGPVWNRWGSLNEILLTHLPRIFPETSNSYCLPLPSLDNFESEFLRHVRGVKGRSRKSGHVHHRQ